MNEGSTFIINTIYTVGNLYYLANIYNSVQWLLQCFIKKRNWNKNKSKIKTHMNNRFEVLLQVKQFRIP